MKAKVTFYVLPSNRVEVSEVISEAIEVTEKEKAALQILCSGARGFTSGYSVNFDMIGPYVVLDTILNGSQTMKDTFCLHPETDEPVSEEEFKEHFDEEFAKFILEQAADLLTGKLSHYYFGDETYITENADGDKVEFEILPTSFLSVSFIDD